MSAPLTAGFAAFMALAAASGCASDARKQALIPSVEVYVSSIDASKGTATLGVANHSRSRALVLTNLLVWRKDAKPVQVARPGPGSEDIILMMHDARLGSGESREHLDVRLDSSQRSSRPAVYACWDNHAWTCDRYWIIPAAQSLDALILHKQQSGDDADPGSEENP